MVFKRRLIVVNRKMVVLSRTKAGFNREIKENQRNKNNIGKSQKITDLSRKAMICYRKIMDLNRKTHEQLGLFSAMLVVPYDCWIKVKTFKCCFALLG